MNISIITAATRSNLLDRVWKSIKNQTYKDWEWIIINDAKPDVAAWFENNKHKLYEVSKNVAIVNLPYNRGRFGLYCRNIGVQMARFDRICFWGETLVETKNGAEFIKNVNIGDEIKTHKGRFCKVKNISKRLYKQKDWHIEIKTPHSSIKCTPEHPFLIKKGNKKLEWIKAKKLKEKMKLLYPVEEKYDFLKFDCYGNNQNNSLKNSEHYGTLQIDQDLARFLGLYLAEGCGGDSAIRFTFNNNEKELIDFIDKVCRDKFHRNPTVYKRWATSVNLNIRSFSELFRKWFGKGARDKRIPKFVFDWNLKNRLAFIKGYVEGDGSNNNTKQVASSSKELLKDFYELCKLSGLKISSPKFDKQKKVAKMRDGKKIYSNGYGYIIISKYSWDKLCDLLEGEYRKGFLQIPIKDIQHKDNGDVYVYNLEVEKDNSYIANSVIAHNCFLDDDNEWKPNHLESLVRLEKKTGKVPFCWIDERGKKPNSTHRRIKKTGFSKQAIDLGCLLWRREDLDQYGLFRNDSQVTFDWNCIARHYFQKGPHNYECTKEPTLIFWHKRY
jgi:intein/homing endonuclease